MGILYIIHIAKHDKIVRPWSSWSLHLFDLQWVQVRPPEITRWRPWVRFSAGVCFFQCELKPLVPLGPISTLPHITQMWHSTYSAKDMAFNGPPYQRKTLRQVTQSICVVKIFEKLTMLITLWMDHRIRRKKVTEKKWWSDHRDHRDHSKKLAK